MPRVVNIHGPGDVRLDAVAAPVAGPRDVIVDVAACGVCGTDVSFVQRGGTGHGATAAAMPLGHEAAGRISALGSDVHGYTIGQRVIINPMGSSGVIGNGGSEGAFTEQLLVRDAADGTALITIPDTMAFELAALAEPLAVALHSVNRADPAPGDKVVVFGAGPIGLGVVIWLRRRGVANIIAVDLAEERLERALAFGADHALRGDDPELAEKIRSLHGADSLFGRPVAGTNVWMDCAGAPSIVPLAVTLGRPGSRLVVTALQKAPVLVDFGRVLASEMTITAAMGYPTELPEALKVLAEMPEASALISHRYGFDQVLEALAIAGTPGSAKVMVAMETADV